MDDYDWGLVLRARCLDGSIHTYKYGLLNCAESTNSRLSRKVIQNKE